MPEVTEKPAAEVTLLPDVNLPSETEYDCDFTADVEGWSLAYQAGGLRSDGASSFDSQFRSSAGGLTRASLSSQMTSPGTAGTDLVSWGEEKPPSTGLPVDSIFPAPKRRDTSNQQQQVGQTQPQEVPVAPEHPRGHNELARGGHGPSEKPGCKCMRSVVYLINDMETTFSPDSHTDQNPDIDSEFPPHKPQGLDSALGLHREAIRYGESMRRCPKCIDRVENVMMLLLLANRMYALCASMVSVFRRLAQDTSSKAWTQACQPSGIISIGEYEVDSTAEGSAVLRELLAFQLRSLHTFVTPLSTTDQLHGAEFHAVRNRAARLWRDLQQNITLSLH